MDSDITKAVIKAATAAQAEKKPEDYYKDGILFCGKCHTNKEKKIQLAGECVTVRCICKCESEERERIQKQKEYEEEMRRIERLRVASLMDAKLESATLKTFTRKEDNQKLYTIVKNYVENFDTFYKSNRGLLFWGTVGTGKSYAAEAMKNQTMPYWTFQGTLMGRNGSEQRMVYSECVPSGQVDLQNITTGDVVKRAWNFAVNQPPALQSLLSID